VDANSRKGCVYRVWYYLLGDGDQYDKKGEAKGCPTRYGKVMSQEFSPVLTFLIVYQSIKDKKPIKADMGSKYQPNKMSE